jgi:hypothetical protein
VLLAGVAAAAPITVNLRVEGSSKTLFEGPVSTEAIAASPGISTESSEGAHPCDVKDNGGNEGFGRAAATPTTALYDAATASGLAFNAKWSKAPLNDFFVTRVGNDVEGGAPEFAAWGYAVNYATANVGGCQFAVAPGNEVLWAYNYFNLPHLLSLAGPTSVNAGTAVTVHVLDGQTGEPMAGSAIGVDVGGVTTITSTSPRTDASGNATISLTHAGIVTLKATRAESVRSNGLTICVHNGDDGTCGTSSSSGAANGTAPGAGAHVGQTAIAAEITGLRDHHHYSRRHAPRVLSGRVTTDAAITSVELRLTRAVRTKAGRLCSYYDGRTARFHKMRCGAAHGRFFPVGDAASFSYLLPFSLPRGRYVLDIEATDAAGDRTALAQGSSRVVFDVG